MTRRRWLQLHGFGALAFAQPLLDLLGRNPTFFVAHRASRTTIILLALAVFVLPGLLASLAVWVAEHLVPDAANAIFHLLFGVFAAVLFLPPLAQMFDERALPAIPLALLVGAVISVLVARVPRVDLFTAYLGLGSVIVLLVFFGISPTADLLWTDDATAVGVGGNDTPVVMVTLDEFALGAIVDANLDLDLAKAPHLAEFATEATWYRNTAANWAYTNRALPSLLTGQLRIDVDSPVASSHPQNLFTITAPSHRLSATEPITALCPSSLCEVQEGATSASLVRDTRTVWLHALLPGELAERWLPPITDSWSGFGQRATSASSDVSDEDLASFPEAATDRVADFRAFTESLPDDDAPTVSFLHSLLPHTPFEYVPSGERYDGFYLRGIENRSLDWTTDNLELLHDHKRRYLLQVGYVDRLLGDLFAELRTKSWYDDALIVVTADHGVSFELSSNKRQADAINLSDVALVPLLVKYPGQVDGVIDDRPAQTIDILPTIADVLDIGLDDPVDGRSLLDDDPPDFRTVVDYDGLNLETDLSLASSAFHFQAAVPAGQSPETVVGVADARGLLGLSTRSLDIGSAEGGFAEVSNLSDYDDVGVGVAQPLRVEVRTSDDFADVVAIAVDGTVASTGPVVDGRADVLLPADALRPGFNEVEVFGVIDGRLVAADDVPAPPFAAIDERVVLAPDQVTIGDRSWTDIGPDVAGFARWRPDLGVVGWAADPTTGALAEHILLVSDQAILGIDGTRTRRVDVVRSTGSTALLWSGFSFVPPSTFDPTEAQVVALFPDGTRYVMTIADG